MSCMYCHFSGDASHALLQELDGEIGPAGPPGFGSARKIAPKR